jgi:hypothetical protein
MPSDIVAVLVLQIRALQDEIVRLRTELAAAQVNWQAVQKLKAAAKVSPKDATDSATE